MKYGFLLTAILFGTLCAHADTLSAVPPEGDYVVGYRTLSVSIPRRDVLAPARGQRRLQLEIWYPAAAANETRKPWASPAMGRALAGSFPFPAGFESKVKTHAFVDAPASSGRFPVILFSHGLSWPVTLYQSYTEDLASRGYLVIGVNHPHGAALIEYDDGSRLDMGAWPKIEDETKRQQFLARHAGEWVADLGYVLDRLFAGELAPGLPADTARIAVLGHSYGGTVAGRLTGDKRVRAAIAMEGAVRDPQDAGARGSLKAGTPFLHLIGGYNRLELENGRYRPSPGAPVYVGVIAGTGHAYFSDLIHLYRPFADKDWKERHRYELEPDRVIRISRDVIAAFLDRYLRGVAHSVLLDSPGYGARVDNPRAGGYPELEMRVLITGPGRNQDLD